MKVLKKSIKGALRALGIEISRTKPFGSDPLRDVQKIYGERAVRTILDVGANEGQAAVEFSRNFPQAKIHSFEPFPKAFQVLEKIERAVPNLVPINAAVGAKSGRQTMYLTNYSCTNSLLPTSNSASHYLGSLMESAGEITVPIETLDEYCSKANVPTIDLLKLDVQGYELEVLKGAERLLQQSRITFILTELNFVSLYDNQAFFHEMYAVLRGRQFQLVSLYNESFRSDPVLGWCDGLFVNLTALEKTRTE